MYKDIPAEFKIHGKTTNIYGINFFFPLLEIEIIFNN